MKFVLLYIVTVKRGYQMNCITRFFRFRLFTERLSFFLFMIIFFGIIGWTYGQYRYLEGNEDGYRLRCKTDLIKKHPELFRDVWQYDVDEVTYKQEDKR